KWTVSPVFRICSAFIRPCISYTETAWPISGWACLIAISFSRARLRLSSCRKGACWPCKPCGSCWMRAGVVSSVLFVQFAYLSSTNIRAQPGKQDTDVMRLPPLSPIRQPDTCRLLPSRFADAEDSVLAPLAAGPEHLADLFALDNA